MSGQRPYGFWCGDSAELLAQYILNHLAFTTIVPRPNDVGHDLHCVLFKHSGRRLIAGPFFAVQVKSRRAPLVYKGEHKVGWIQKQENPFFICVANRKALTIELYSTWNRLNATLLDGAEKIELIPGEPITEDQDLHAKNGTQNIPLGPPIIRVGVEDIKDQKRLYRLSEILQSWVLLDRQNIGNKNACMYWTHGPISYEMNKPLPAKQETGKWLFKFYWDNPNFDQSLTNFTRAATALRLVHNKCDHDKKQIWSQKIRALEGALNAYRDYVEKKEGLLKYTGLNLIKDSRKTRVR